MKLKILKRTAEKKAKPTDLRREGLIPAVIYSKGKDGENIAVKSAEFNASTAPIEARTTFHNYIYIGWMKTEKNAERFIKDIQYEVTTL